MSKNNGNHLRTADGPERHGARDGRAEAERLLGKVGVSAKTLEEWGEVVRLMRRVTPGGDRLSFDQLLRMARENADVYRRFLNSKRPVNAWEVRVGGKKLWETILRRPDGMKETTFQRNLPRDAVLEIWCAAGRGLEEVPLLFQPMEEVTEEGLSITKLYDDGQSFTLEVGPNGDGEFWVRLSFAGVAKPFEVAKVHAGGGCARTRKTRLEESISREVFARNHGQWGRLAASVVLAFVLAGITHLFPWRPEVFRGASSDSTLTTKQTLVVAPDARAGGGDVEQHGGGSGPESAGGGNAAAQNGQQSQVRQQQNVDKAQGTARQNYGGSAKEGGPDAAARQMTPRRTAAGRTSIRQTTPAERRHGTGRGPSSENAAASTAPDDRRVMTGPPPGSSVSPNNGAAGVTKAGFNRMESGLSQMEFLGPDSKSRPRGSYTFPSLGRQLRGPIGIALAKRELIYVREPDSDLLPLDLKKLMVRSSARMLLAMGLEATFGQQDAESAPIVLDWDYRYSDKARREFLSATFYYYEEEYWTTEGGCPGVTALQQRVCGERDRWNDYLKNPSKKSPPRAPQSKVTRANEAPAG